MQEVERLKILKKFGADDEQAKELLRYNKTFSRIPACEVSDEPFVSAWNAYCAEAAQAGAFDTLKKYIVQFSFPIRAGISATEVYKIAALRGVITSGCDGGVTLVSPEALSLYIHKTAVGRIPVLLTECREDFVTLVRVLSHKNEPFKIPASMGGCMVSGFNNWDRIGRYRKAWQEQHPDGNWEEEFLRMVQRRELYQDCFIILCNNGYSNIPAGELGIEEEEWKRLSVIIRREHECVHYITQRLFGGVRNNAFDELIADYAGIRAALGRYDAGWFLRFMGLERYPEYREGARLENYKGTQPLTDGAFVVLQRLIYQSALNLEAKNSTEPIAETVLKLLGLSLEKLAIGEYK